jgi:hypothetical protein
MRPYLFLSVFIFSLININAQSSSRSTITFNYSRGLNTDNQKSLDNIYHGMNDLNYHCFDLISKQEISTYSQPKLIKLVKARANKIMEYYMTEKSVDKKNVFVKYGGQFPTLWLHKPTSRLTVSGNIMLDDNNRQCFNVNPAIDNMLTSDNGNRFYFPPNAFETMDGFQVTNKNIDICLYEFMDKKSLVYSGLTTDANGKMLETAGSFYIEANLDGEKLKLRRGESYTIEMQSPKSFPDMFTYYGGQNSGIIDWTVDKNEPAIYASAEIGPEFEGKFPQKQEEQVLVSESEWNNYDEYGDNILDAPYIESVQAVNFYEMSAGKLGWINCDRFYEVENTSTLAVRVDSDSAMVVRIIFKDINSVMPCYSNSNHKDQYEASGIPKGEKVIILAYSVKDENAIFGYKEVTIGENDMESISLSNLSKTSFQSSVSQLLSF